jgi:hypothetical protein
MRPVRERRASRKRKCRDEMRRIIFRRIKMRWKVR